MDAPKRTARDGIIGALIGAVLAAGGTVTLSGSDAASRITAFDEWRREEFRTFRTRTQEQLTEIREAIATLEERSRKGG